MALEYKDYYQALGVPRTATQDDLRKAFRKLARQYHPDVAKDKKTAETRFKEINEAYEVLGDPEKRKKYDALGANWKQGAEFRPPPGFQWARGGGWPGGANGGPGRRADFEFQFGGTGFSDFFEQLFGSTGRGHGRSSPFRQQAPEEFGAPTDRGGDVESDIMVSLHEAMHGSLRPISLQRREHCPHCFGTGQVNGRRCDRCGGQGRIVSTETYKVKIPAGVRDGQRLRLGGKGEKGSGGGPAGDLYLRVRLEKHPDFRVENEHLFTEIEVAPWEAVLGATIAVPTLDGPLKIKVPAGAQNGQRLRVRGHGLPLAGGTGRGDLFVVIRVQVPDRVSERERKLWEELANESKFTPRA